MQENKWIVTFHGNIATASMMRRDTAEFVDMMGLPAAHMQGHKYKFWWRWDDLKTDKKSEQVIRYRKMWFKLGRPEVIAVGYSQGGSFLATQDLPGVVAYVLYESPVMIDRPYMKSGGARGAIIIWNDNGWLRYPRGQEQYTKSHNFWEQSVPEIVHLEGTGRHIEWFPPAHAWDDTLNWKIREQLYRWGI